MLTTYRITCSDGSTIETNMAANVTLTDAKEYFLGRWFDVGVYPEEKMVKAVDVRQLGRCCSTCKRAEETIYADSPCMTCVHDDNLPNYIEKLTAPPVAS